MESSLYWKQLRKDVIATAQPNCNGQKLGEMFVPLPPLAEQKRIVAKIEELFTEVEKVAAAKDCISRTADRINQKVLNLAIRGQLVPQDPNDEPAEVLLKRIAEARRKTKTGRSRPATKDESVIFRAADRSAYETRNGKTGCIDDEIPFEIPDSWAWARLDAVCDAQLGKMLDKAKNVGTPYKYLANANVRWGSFDFSDVRETLFTSEEVEKFALRNGDVVMCEGGAPGRCAVWQSEIADMKFQKAVHRLRSSVLLPLFIQNFFAYAVSTDWFKAKLTGTTIKHLPREALISILIPIPPLAEQKRIVAKIEEVRGMVGLITRT